MTQRSITPLDVSPRSGTRFPLPLGRGRALPPGGPTALMGVLNVTPDSFSDGGRFASVDDVVGAARAMVDAGAAVLDVGGESTRPGAAPVDEAEELRRVVPVVRALVARIGAPVSVDTTKAAVFWAAWEAGASMLNDVSALAADPALAAAVARTDAAVVLMHRRGGPATMQLLSAYDDVVADVARELELAVVRAREAGVSDARLILDPGLGFAKTPAQTFRLIAEIDAFRLGRFPLLVGPSRKSFLGRATGRGDARDRDAATAVVVSELARRGVDLVRVHDVASARDAVRVAAALAEAAEGAP